MKLIFTLIFYFFIVWIKETSVAVQPRGRIIGGQRARSGQFPFMAAINVHTQDSTFFCGGALITDQWLLTSGHCIYEAVSLIIRLGTNFLEETDSHTVVVSTSHVVPHPDFNPETLENDVGLIKLRSAVQLGEKIQVVGLASTALPEYSTVIATGWGQTSDDEAELAPELNFVQLSTLPNQQCRLIYGNQITDNMVCASGNYNEGSCYGDSGGPIINLFNQHVGISCFFSGNGCESTDPSGYTRTYSYVDWIDNVTSS